ncbi:MAG: hypothetical protein IPL33_06570 [Sphingobacteriales bacterium]|nr:hypothetical protein [Sphingobacteriales bacterium]
MYFNLNISEKLNEREYETLCDFVQSNTRLETLSFETKNILKSIFFTKPLHISNEDLAKYWVENEISVTEEQLKVLLKIQDSSKSFLAKYIIKQNISPYRIRLKETNEKQYTCEHVDINDFLAKAKPQSYFCCPQNYCSISQNDSSLQQTDDSFTTNLIEKYGSEQCFIKLVAGANDRIKQYF